MGDLVMNRILSRVEWAREIERLVAASEEMGSASNLHDRENAEHRRDKSLDALDEHDDYERKAIERIRKGWDQTKEALDHMEVENRRLRKDFRRVQDKLVEMANEVEALQSINDALCRAYGRNDEAWENRCEVLITLLRRALPLLADGPGTNRLTPKIQRAIKHWEEEYEHAYTT